MFKSLSLAAALCVAGGAAFACPDWQADANFEIIRLDADFQPDPFVTDTVAGGDIDLSGCLEGAYGFATSNPDYDVHWGGNSSTGELYFKFDGGGDTIMLVNGPDETWYFNDDASGLDPIVKIENPSEGLYSIWIATVDQNPVQGRFLISEIQ